MNYLMALILLFTAGELSAFPIIGVEKLSLSLSQFKDNRDPYTPYIGQKEYDHRAALVFNLNILRYGFWENKTHVETVNNTARTVGWHWMLGVHIHSGIDLFHEHHSRHIMEEKPQVRTINRTQNQFPVEDSFGIRFNIVDTDKYSRRIFE